jgi:transcription-repair coupling factor (superfamily II helicase)
MDAIQVSEGLSRLVARVSDSYPFVAVTKALANKRLEVVAPSGAQPWILSAIGDLRKDKKLSQQCLVVVSSGREAEDLVEFLKVTNPDAEVLEFASWETLPHERLSPSAETVGRRLKTLHRLNELNQEKRNKQVFVVASIRAALQPVVLGLADYPPLTLKVEGEYLLPELTLKLVEIAYQRVDMVTKRGEFAVRGGILDIFPTTSSHAIRLEFFGDELEQMREFSVADQRSLDGRPQELTVYPAREIIITPQVALRAREMEHEFPNLSTMLAKIGQGIPVDGMESLAPALVDSLGQISDYLAEDAYVVLLSPEKSMARATNLIETNEEFLHAAWDAALEGAKAPIDLSAGGFKTLHDFTTGLNDRALVSISSFLVDETQQIALNLLEIPKFKGMDVEPVDYIADQLSQGQQVVIASPGHGTAQRIAEILEAAKIPARVLEELPESIEDVSVAVKEVLLIQAPIRKGFAAIEAKLILLTDSDFFGRGAGYSPVKRPRLAAKRGQAVDPLALKAGDYVVHEIHGIGRFVEMVQRQLGNTKNTREYLVIEYAPSKRGLAGDVLYVPTDQLDFLTRYVGGEAPVLSKMGGTDWSRVKGNARKAVRKIAIDLVKLYSARMNAKGYAFLPDTAWQREMEDSFPFVETPDQLNTVEEIKRDMERPVPMDRLVAGDVGYGKTEIAIRAAFKAVQDGKQVAVLVPTTLLVRQHVETFIERFAGFPVNVRALSRFQSAKESKETIAAMATGEVDVVIGTHRLLSAGVKFRDLGLIIIDEEQRFGVEHKEKLKDIKTNVDVLSMSATPIPRTLEMAITGIREMSTLATPPEERHPILTYIGPYNEKQVAAAIHRELIREGQVFFVHNRVDSIDKVASRLAALVPEARIAVAHGQMNEGQLEQVVIDFWERRYDVLVSTTIIEAGIDIPNANTLIVDRSENFGLSQLHQIRGRVGRSRERAYAYFLYSPDKPLSPFALDRLSTIAANNELGSGMQVALKDLEIRGAGNLLGGEQSGHIAGVGFDLYLRMIGEAVDEFKGIKHESPAELKLEIPIDAHIPIAYVDSERLRLEAYHKLSAASGELGTRVQLDAIFQELEDRYGKAPQSVKNLIDVTELRQQCNRLNLKDVMMIGNQFKLTPVELTEVKQIQLSHVYPGLRYLASAKQLSVPAPRDSEGEILQDRALIDWAWVFLALVFTSLESE